MKSLIVKAFLLYSNKELDIISCFHYNIITYHRYDRKGLEWQEIETHMKLEKILEVSKRFIFRKRI